MAEDFAKKGWHFAQKQQQHSQTSVHSPTSHTRQYSTLSVARVSTKPPSLSASDPSRMSPTSSYSCGAAGENSLMALMTGDAASFPPRLRGLRESLSDFMEEYIVPNERAVLEHQQSDDRWTPLPLMEKMKVSSSLYS